MLTIIKDAAELDRRLKARRIHPWDEETIRRIISQVEQDGDKALRELTRRYDKVDITDLKISQERIEKAVSILDPDLKEALLRAGDNIRRFHDLQIPGGYSFFQPDGTRVEYNWRPIRRVGIYIPGGRFPLVSTVLMNCIPALVAGVQEIAVCTPPAKNGYPDNMILATCGLLGIREIYCLGGAQAIAALALGTETVPAVDKITGPGNSYVAGAKQILSHRVGIDMAAGPTEVVVVADKSADPECVSADLISQAEHDPDSLAILMTDHEPLARKVQDTVGKFLPKLDTQETASMSLSSQGTCFVGNTMDDIISIVNRLAPEHVVLQVQNPEYWKDRVTAGAIFLGPDTPVAWGDYWAGPNHTLPTSGQARFRGPLSTQDFMVPYTVIKATPFSLNTHGDKVQLLADAEGLTGHSLSVKIRRNDAK